MTQGIRFDPNARRYDLETLKQAFDPSFAEQLDKTVTIATEGDREKILEELALQARTSALLGVSTKRGQPELALRSMNDVQSVIEAPSKDQFAGLPADLRRACERAWDLAREATIMY
jgi:hypothetical protein